MEPLQAGTLRAAGWTIPPHLPADYTFRVYDLRLDGGWMTQMLPSLGLGTGPEHYVIGGDFLTQPHVEDAVALQTSTPKRWGPSGDKAYHLVVPPRLHANVWLPRVRQQLLLEADGTWITILLVVDRIKCPAAWTPATLLQALPHAASILQDPLLEVRVAAIGERPPLVRIPADERKLPQTHWEQALLARDRVLVAVSLRGNAGEHRPVYAHWLGQPPPPVQQHTLELLRLQYVLPPATKAASGERALRAVVRKVVSMMGADGAAPFQLRQVQVTNGVASALLGVPTSSARLWLRSSGFEGLYIRPFWTPTTGAAVARDQFQLIWVKGQLAAGPRLWAGLHELPGFFGLLADNKDVAIRVSDGADRAVFQRHIAFVVGDHITVKSVEPGMRWWRLGPLTEAELWRVKDLISATGLQLARPELRQARLGPFRWAVYFAARGQPSTASFDDGSWNSSAAQLTPADPPPRRKPNTGATTTSQSPWGGPRPVTSTAQAQAGPAALTASLSDFPALASTATATAAHRSPKPSQSTPAASPVVTSTSQSRSDSPSQQRRDNRKGRATAAPATVAAQPPTDGMAALVAQLSTLNHQFELMQVELRELRAENRLLHQQLAAARGVQQHQPYTAIIPSVPLPVIEPPNFAYTPPRPAVDGRRPASELTTAPPGTVNSPPVALEPKRARHSDAPEGAETVDADMPEALQPATSPTPTSAGARRTLSLGPHGVHGF